MPDLLLELFSEEIPARMQAQAADTLKKMVTDALVERGLLYEGAKAFVTPRRLALVVHGLPGKQADQHEDKKGPRVGAPEAALAGFLKSAGLDSIEQAHVHSDPKKGDFYVAHIHRAGRPTPEVLAEFLPQIIRTFPWPKSMRWGSGNLRWVRPLHSIVCTFGTEIDEPEVVPFEVDGIASSNITYGHRFMGPQAITVKRLDDWMAKLEAARVVVDRERRKDIILNDAKDLALARGLELVEDEGLLEEVAGLVEWPVVLMGEFEERFLDIPDEVIRATIRANQKCFVLKDPKTGRLANRFILTSNLLAHDGGKAIVAGNGRVIRARLSDAKFFWDTDRANGLEKNLPKFANITFHEKLGSQQARIERIAALAVKLAPQVGADAALTEQAALLAKADLLTEVVGEFPELQGLMGRYYALGEGVAEEVALACEEHYKPQGPGDRVPTAPVAIAVALADKIDTLAGFWAIDEKPTGSKDPYALRRAALGIIRIILENGVRVRLGEVIAEAARGIDAPVAAPEGWQTDLLGFFADRLKVYLRDNGARFDLVDAVFALEGQDDLFQLVSRMTSLARFLETEDGRNLLAGYRRAVNILRIEEKKDGKAYAGPTNATLLKLAEEEKLASAIEDVKSRVGRAIAAEDFEAAMTALADLRGPVDAFFDAVTVNAPEADQRENRLKLLDEIRTATRTIADFDRIEG